jgi:two-component system, cell cycle sensor histidine kinase and response regulator CckA
VKESLVSSAAQLAQSPIPLRVLLVGKQEENFFVIREILERTRSTFAADLDHAHSLDDAKVMLRRRPYGLVLFEHETGNAAAVQLLAKFLQAGISVPFVVLTEDADERTIAELIDAGTWNCLAKSQLDGATLVRTMRNTLAMHVMHQGQQAAEESVRKLSRAVEQSADSVMVTDDKGLIQYVNPAFESLTGYTQDEVLQKSPRVLRSGQQTPEFYQDLWKTIRAGNVFRGILVNRKKNGELYYLEENISPVRDTDGRITHFISNGRDLTDRLRLEAQLSQAQKMDAIGRLAGGVAHDFNNLLTIITSYSELALDGVPQASPLESKLREILQAARRAAELTRQLLAFSRKQPQSLRVVELNPIVAGIAKTLPRLIGEDIKFTFEPREGLGRVRVDPAQIEQVLMNLAANARDAMRQGGHLSIETADVELNDEYVQCRGVAIPTGRYALISISDDGDGISAEHLPHIFEPFYTTKLSGQGTGLGLATVYGIVKQNKGFIWAYSERGQGTVFKIYLPCVDSKNTQPGNREKRESPLRGSETIMLVEDEAAVRQATVEFLTRQGYRVLEACDGQEALSVAQNYGSRIHLVVTDVVMPNMSGGQLATELRKQRPEAKLVFVSGYAGKTVMEHHVFDAEMNFLQKPYSLKDLSRKIRAALDADVNAGTNAASNTQAI